MPEYEITTIGDVAPSGALVEPFAGCTNRTQLAAFLAAGRVESFTKGLLYGAAIGLVVSFGVATYLRSEGHL